MITEITYF